MDTFWIRAVSQSGVYLTFLVYLGWSLRRGVRAWAPLLGTVLYAILFEHFNMLRYAHVVGGYYYNARSWLFLWGDVPLYIPLAWAFIVSTSQALTDRLGISGWRRPVCDALLTLLIDLSLDVVAIRLNFWYWRGIGRSEAFFGVPADNFLGWLLVTFTFSLLTRRLWRSLTDRANGTAFAVVVQWFVIPPAAYLMYLVIEWVVHRFYFLFHASTPGGQLAVLGGVIALFLAAVATGSRNRGATEGGPLSDLPASNADAGRASQPVNRLALHGPRQVFHLFGLIGLLCVPAAARAPALWLIALAVWAIEWAVTWSAHARDRSA